MSDKPFYRIGWGDKPSWYKEDMPGELKKGDYVIKSKYGILKARDRTMSEEARKRKEEMLCKLHG